MNAAGVQILLSVILSELGAVETGFFRSNPQSEIGLARQDSLFRLLLNQRQEVVPWN
jgi:hypothetical protein